MLEEEGFATEAVEMFGLLLHGAGRLSIQDLQLCI
jgi:hypothetical protein